MRLTLHAQPEGYRRLADLGKYELVEYTFRITAEPFTRQLDATARDLVQPVRRALSRGRRAAGQEKIDVAEAARRTELTESQLRRLAARGRLGASEKVRGRWEIDWDALQRYVSEGLDADRRAGQGRR